MVKSIIKANEILKLFQDKQAELGFNEIREYSQEKRSTLYNILQTLEQIGFIKKTGTAKYQLGSALISYGATARRSIKLINLAHPILQALMRKTNYTTYIAILSQFETIHIDALYPPKEIRFTTDIGARSPLYCTGLGKACLAYQEHEMINEYLEKIELIPMTKNTITNRSRLLDELRVTRARGYSIDHMERSNGLTCFGAPIFNEQNSVLGAISISSSQVDQKNLQDHIDCLKKSAEMLSKALGSNRSLDD